MSDAKEDLNSLTKRVIESELQQEAIFELLTQGQRLEQANDLVSAMQCYERAIDEYGELLKLDHEFIGEYLMQRMEVIVRKVIAHEATDIFLLIRQGESEEKEGNIESAYKLYQNAFTGILTLTEADEDKFNDEVLRKTFYPEQARIIIQTLLKLGDYKNPTGLARGGANADVYERRLIQARQCYDFAARLGSEVAAKKLKDLQVTSKKKARRKKAKPILTPEEQKSKEEKEAKQKKEKVERDARHKKEKELKAKEQQESKEKERKTIEAKTEELKEKARKEKEDQERKEKQNLEKAEKERKEKEAKERKEQELKAKEDRDRKDREEKEKQEQAAKEKELRDKAENERLEKEREEKEKCEKAEKARKEEEEKTSKEKKESEVGIHEAAHPIELEACIKGSAFEVLKNLQQKLRESGYELLLVGGAPRCFWSNSEFKQQYVPKDIDVVASCDGKQLLNILYALGKTHVQIDKNQPVIRLVENDIDIGWVSDAAKKKDSGNVWRVIMGQDAERRMVHIGAMYARLDFVRNEMVIYGSDQAFADLKNAHTARAIKTLTFITDPNILFAQDPFRMLKIAKVMAEFGIDDKVAAAAIMANASRLRPPPALQGIGAIVGTISPKDYEERRFALLRELFSTPIRTRLKILSRFKELELWENMFPGSNFATIAARYIYQINAERPDVGLNSLLESIVFDEKQKQLEILRKSSVPAVNIDADTEAAILKNIYEKFCLHTIFAVKQAARKKDARSSMSLFQPIDSKSLPSGSPSRSSPEPPERLPQFSEQKKRHQ